MKAALLQRLECDSDLKNLFVQIFDEHEQKIKLLEEELAYLRQIAFGRKSEKRCVSSDNITQLLLPFEQEEETEPSAAITEEEPRIEVAKHSRKRGRKPLPAHLPVEETLVDIPEADKLCECGTQKTRIGQETSDKLEFIPAKALINRIIRPKYACKNCEGTESSKPAVSIAPMPPQIIPKSFATPSLLAHIISSKFIDSLPLYRLSGMFSRHGIEISRGTLASWCIKVSALLKPMYELLLELVLSADYIHVDETRMQVLKEAGRKATDRSWMWVLRSGGSNSPAVYFHYDPSRGKKVISEILTDFKGYIQTDGYTVYNHISRQQGQVHLGCMAHARRKFVDSVKVAGKNAKPGIAHEALEIFKKLYRIEREAKQEGLTAQQIHDKRNQEAKPILHDFKTKLLEWQRVVVPKSKTGNAVAYTLNVWDRLNVYLQDGQLEIDNNSVERAIKPFAVGRKNWLFADSQSGARATAILYGIVETAKANGLEPYWYLMFLLEKAVYAKTKEDFRALMPHNIDKQAIKQLQEKHINAPN